MVAKRDFTLPDTELVEVVAFNGSKTTTKIMTFGEWLKLNKNPKYHYLAYQIGFRNNIKN